jgi:predicted outer membrane repeat protein
MKKLLLAFFLVPVFLCSYGSKIELSGIVSGSYNYDTLLITGDIYIENGSALHINPGTIVLFDGFYFVDVQGRIVSAGTAPDPIIFTVSDTLGFADTLAMHGAWHGIRFSNTPSTNLASEFVYTQFSYTKALDADSLLQFGGAIHANGYSKVFFANCTFTQNRAFNRGGAIAMLNSSHLSFNNCVFEKNATFNKNDGFGGAVYCENSAPVFKFCTFAHNSAVWTGGAMCFYYADPIIQNCILNGNNGYIGGGMSFYKCLTTNTISNNLIYNNLAEYFGGGISCNRSSNPVFVNNTIVANQSTYGGGFYCNDSAAPKVYNSIIWDNIDFSGLGPVYIWDPLSHPDFFYCDIQGGKEQFAGSGGGLGYFGQYENNFDTVPMFETGYGLSYSSPLINAGTPDTTGLGLPPVDLNGLPRIWNGQIDLGAYEVMLEGIDYQNSQHILPLDISPNPVVDGIKIKLPTFSQPNAQLTLLSMEGKKIYSRRLLAHEQNTPIEINLSYLEPGNYILTLTDGKLLAVGKIAKTKN